MEIKNQRGSQYGYATLKVQAATLSTKEFQQLLGAKQSQQK